MEKIQKSTPALRFRDGQGNSYPDWEERKLGQIFTVRYGKEHKKLSDGNVPVIGTGGVIRYANGVLYSEPSVLIGRKGTIDKPQFINQPFWAVDTVFFTEIGPSNVSYFVFLIVSKINWKRYNEASGLPSLSANTIKGIRVNIPSKEEQQKIANFLSSIDTKIEQLGKKKALVEQYKKGVIQRLFSQEIRFKDEQGKDYPNWKKQPIREIGEIIGGGTPATNKNSFWNGTINWFTPSEIKSKYSNSSIRKISEQGLAQSSAKLLPVGTVLFTSRATVGEVSIAREECTTNQGFQSFVLNNSSYSNEYTYYWIGRYKKLFLRIANGSTYLEVTNSEIKKILFDVPDFEEQQKIANFLSAIDKKIELVAEQLQQARTFKKGLLQQMFI